MCMLLRAVIVVNAAIINKRMTSACYSSVLIVAIGRDCEDKKYAWNKMFAAFNIGDSRLEKLSWYNAISCEHLQTLDADNVKIGMHCNKDSVLRPVINRKITVRLFEWFKIHIFTHQFIIVNTINKFGKHFANPAFVILYNRNACAQLSQNGRAHVVKHSFKWGTGVYRYY